MKLKIKLYYVYFFLITMFKAFGFDSSSKLYVAIFAFGCAIVLLKVCTESFKIRELISMVVVVTIGLLNWLIGGFSPVLTTAIALCGLKNVDIDRLIKMSFWIRLFAFVAMIVLSGLGVVEAEVVDFYRNGEIIKRHTFGYGHPNTTHMMFAVIVLLALYVYGQKMNIAHYALIVLANHALFVYTGSRTGALILWIAMICHLMLYVKRFRSAFIWLSKYIYVFLFIVTMLLGFGYGKYALINTLDLLLTGRIYYVNLILMEEVPALFGHEEFTDIVVDNGYMELLFNGGILTFAWFSYYFIKVANKLASANRLRELLLIVCFTIFNLAESSFEIISVNVSLLFIGEFIFETRSGYKHDRDNSLYTNIQSREENRCII